MKSFIKLTDFKKSELFEIFKIADSIEQYEGFLKGKTIVLMRNRNYEEVFIYCCNDPVAGKLYRGFQGLG